ncbi:hypothetical protein BFGS084_01247 [Bacteroides fragilis]|nr:hypothetical protein BFGS084_01247 [Bacteroides fragilis]
MKDNKLSHNLKLDNVENDKQDSILLYLHSIGF